MQGTLFNQENAALQPMYFWFGQIVDDSTWKDNELSQKWNDPDEIPGWGSRFRVRIFGRDIGDVDNSRLDMAECIYPVTAGSGHAACYQSTNLSKGAYVIGFYRDGIDREDPVILGCLGNNDQTQLSQTLPLKPFESIVVLLVKVSHIIRCLLVAVLQSQIKNLGKQIQNQQRRETTLQINNKKMMDSRRMQSNQSVILQNYLQCRRKSSN